MSKIKTTTTLPTQQEPSDLHTRPFCVVGVGASTGGQEAINTLLKAMPPDSGVAIVVVQHLLPGHTSLSAELFGANTTMPVLQAVQGLPLQANHVYTAPPDQYVTLHNGCFELTARSSRKSLSFPIDYFFKSLAQEYGEHAVGVVLSGNGHDGTAGVQVLAGESGLVLVQDPETAQADSMPRSAIATELADEVLTLQNIPKTIGDYVKYLQKLSTAASGKSDKTNLAEATASDGATTDTKAIKNLLKIMLARRGHDFSGYKRKTLLRRVARRMGLHNMDREADYVALLKKDPKEVDALFYDLLIGVTDFFRDPQAWEVLDSEVITPLIAAKKKDDSIRIWVPGCSTGEEPYTMAMLVLDKLRRARKHCLVQIFATDTNQQALETGRLGHYPLSIANRITPQLLRRYFVLAADQQHYAVSDELRSAVVFGNQNLFSDPPFGRVDVISCRNVLIYLSAEVQKNIMHTFHFALRKDGYLFLGNAESNSGRDDLFKPLSSSWRIFQRIGAARFQAFPLPLSGGEVRNPAGIPALTESPATLAANLAQKLIMERFAPASVLVNSAFEALYFCGSTDEFLLRPAGAPTQDLLAMVREGLRSRLHGGLQQAASKDQPVTISGVLMKVGEVFQAVEITITPAHKTTHAGAAVALGSCYLVVFELEAQQLTVAESSSAQTVLVRHLEDELQLTRQDLATTTERFEDANERLRISNELVLTSNETLRTLNEELESSKEELQSYNEEITTVNQQLETKIRELEASNADIQNLLTSSDIATVCLDNALRIKWFAPAAQRLFSINSGNIGYPIIDVVMLVGDSQLLLDARSVLAGQAVRDAEFFTINQRCYIRRLIPYKNVNRQIEGVILTYTDITESYFAAQAALVTQRDLDATRERAESMRVLSAALANAEERERRTLAKDLHDDLGQLLSVIALKASMLQKQEMPDALRVVVADCANAVQTANQKMRDIALQLNPPMLDQLGLIPAMQWLADEMHRLYKLDVTIKDDGLPKPMDPAVSATLFRALRELLLNVTKHARVAAAEISTEHNEDNTLTVKVNDAGGGLNPAVIDPHITSKATGLVSIRERMGYLGGEMSIASNPGVGTTVVLKVPLLTPQAPATPSPKPAGTNPGSEAKP